MKRHSIRTASILAAIFLILPGTAPAQEDWRPLFNGRDTTGWSMAGPGEFRVEDGSLATYGGMGLLWYEREKFGNCEIRVVFRPEGERDNSGVFIRIPDRSDDPWFAVHNGYEVQIDNSADEWHRTGSIYSIAKVQAEFPPTDDGWTTMIIRLDGDRTQVSVNGVAVTDFRQGDPVPERKASSEPVRGPRPNVGYIGLQNHRRGDRLFFKDVSVRPLPPKPTPGAEWTRAESPESLGWSSEKLAEARAYSETIDTAGVMLVTQGVVLDQWGDLERKFSTHSIRKSFLSALYGIFVGEGKIDITKTLANLGIDDNEPSLTDTEKKAAVQDMLKARSGVYHPALAETANMRAAKPERHSHEPGTFFYYNNWDFNALGAIFNQETESDLFVEFERRIAEPLGMQDFSREDDTRYQRGRASIHPAYPFTMSGRDMARFGLMFLNNGQWGDRQIVPSRWVKESTTSYSTAISHNDGANVGGYGYLWWIAVDGNHYAGMQTPEGAYSARGVGGHTILVLPSHDLVVVHRVNTFERGRAVSGEEFGKLLSLILDAKIEGEVPH